MCMLFLLINQWKDHKKEFTLCVVFQTTEFCFCFDCYHNSFNERWKQLCNAWQLQFIICTIYNRHPEFRLQAASFFFLVRETRIIIMRVPLSRASVPLSHPLDESIEKEKLCAVYPNLRSGPILAVLIHSPCPPECYFRSETKIEPDLS